MDKSAIKSFAIEARKILMKSAITQAGFYGVSKDGCSQPTQKGAGFEVYRTIAGTDNRIFGDDIKRREKLVKAVEEKGFDQVIEETAYTWFNRLIAIRFMEVNGYLPTRTRVLSSEAGSNTPDLMSQYMDVDLDMTMDELEKVQTFVRENRYDDAFALLFVKQCNALNEILPELFERTNDYMELLLKLSYTSDGVVRMLVDMIPESNFDIEQEGQIEIIGWLYQYYNTELKDDTFALLKKNVKITKERIPSATQLFTPDWIVRYMVENSLGRLWVEGHPDEDLKASWKYYVEEAEQEVDVQVQLNKIRKEYKNLNPEDIKVIDPCMGSGHILVYCFDVLMQIYVSQGYTERDAARLILENNLYGLDIDKRAAQLAYFAVMMKARQYDRRVLMRNIKSNVHVIVESNNINTLHINYLGTMLPKVEREKALKQIIYLLEEFQDAKEYGSILKIERLDWELLKEFCQSVEELGQISFNTMGIDVTQKLLLELIKVAEIMTQKYHAVVTNPPYMGAAGMNSKLTMYVKNNYPDSKSDMSTVCMEKTIQMCDINGYMSMINIPVWMFISSYEKLRNKMVSDDVIINMLHLGRGIFGSDFGTTAFVIQNQKLPQYRGVYHRLFEKQGAVDSVDVKENWFLERKGKYISQQICFNDIPGVPIAYWVSKQFIRNFEQPHISDSHFSGGRNKTHGNEQYTRMWWEISDRAKWQLYVKGGDFRRWYGNHDVVVDWSSEARTEYASHGGLYNQEYANKEGICWTLITSAKTAFRKKVSHAHYDSGAPTIFNKEFTLDKCVLGFLNSNVATEYLQLLNPTINMGNTYVLSLPNITLDENRELIEKYVDENIELAKKDWDAYENSCDFKRHPMCEIDTASDKVELSFKKWRTITREWFDTMKDNEIKLNQIFLDGYGLNKEIKADISDKDISIRIAEEKESIKNLISYAIGCILGRYSLDEAGLIYAGIEWNTDKYHTFIPDIDNCIPITDEEYFEDDIVGLFCKWIKIVYGEGCLEENLDYIANILGNKGATSREVIRNYFLNDFMKDHVKIYQKRPIYWMFDSGKQNGFKCLTYMHRYDRDTVGRVRSDYLRKSQEAIEAALKNAEYTIQNSSSAIDKANATKKRDKYIKQLSEIRTYFQALSHVALQRIDIDLDDGVKVNYEKFQNIEIVDENGKKQKINLLAKI